MVDRQTGQLSPRIQTIMEKGQAVFGEQIKAEMLQSTVEINSDILPDIPTARREMRDLRARLARLVTEEGLVLISAGTHPTALWQNEQRTPHERYAQLEQELQDVARSILIFGLHIHIGIESHDLAVELMNQLRTWLPHLLAISTNSPCWAGCLTGLKSYAALCQALVAKLTWLYKRGLSTPALSGHFIEENKWRVMHAGLDANVFDFVQGRRLSMRESIGELLDVVDDVAVDLGSRHEMDYLRGLLEDPRGTGADR